jgi:pimeloyl-ACP methyl ester carboxylesterase
MAKTWDVLMANPMHADVQSGVPEFLKVWRYLNGDVSFDERMARAYTEKIYKTESIEPAWNHMAVQEGVPDLFAALSRSDVPLLFVHGEADRLVQNAENIKTLAANLEQVSCRVLANVGHVFFNSGVWQEIEQVMLDHFQSGRSRRQHETQ